MTKSQIFCHSCGTARPDLAWCDHCRTNVNVTPTEYCGTCGTVTGKAKAENKSTGQHDSTDDQFDTSGFNDRDRIVLNSVKQSVLAAIAADRFVGAELWNFTDTNDEADEDQSVRMEGGRLVARRRKGRIASELHFTCALGTFVQVTSIIRPSRAADVMAVQAQMLLWLRKDVLSWEGALYYLEAVRAERAGSAIPLADMHQVYFATANRRGAARVTRDSQRSRFRGPSYGGRRNAPWKMDDALFRKAKDNGWCVFFQLGKCKMQGSSHAHTLTTGKIARLQHVCVVCQDTAHGWSACPSK